MFAYYMGTGRYIFPEFAALAVGCWLVPKPVWRYSRGRLVALAVVCAVCGMGVSGLCAWFDVSNRVGFFSAFLLAGLLFSVTHTSIRPLMSAMLLPVLFGERRIGYPVTVLVLCLILVLVQWLMEHKGSRMRFDFVPVEGHALVRMFRFVLLSVGLVPLLLFSSVKDYDFLIVPPLIVAYVEFFNSSSGFTQRPVAVLSQIAVAALVGSVMDQAGTQLIVSHIVAKTGWQPALMAGLLSVVSLTVLFFYARCSGFVFAPAAALLVIPFFRNPGFLYPLFIDVSAVYVVVVPLLFRSYVERLVARFEHWCGEVEKKSV